MGTGAEVFVVGFALRDIGRSTAHAGATAGGCGQGARSKPPALLAWWFVKRLPDDAEATAGTRVGTDPG